METKNSENHNTKDKENNDSTDKLTNQMRKCVINQKEKDKITNYLSSAIRMPSFTKLKETNTNLIKNETLPVTNLKNNDNDLFKKVSDDKMKQNVAVECKTAKKMSKIHEYLNSKQAPKKKFTKISSSKVATADSSECSSVASTSMSSSSQASTSSTSVTPLSRSPSLHSSANTKLIRDKSHSDGLSNASEKSKKVEPKRADEFKVNTTNAPNQSVAKKPSRLSEYLRKEKTVSNFPSTTNNLAINNKPQSQKSEWSPSIKSQKSQFFCMCNDLASLSPISNKIANIVNTAKSLNNSKSDDNRIKINSRSLSLDKYNRTYEYFLPNTQLVDYFRKKSIEWSEMSKNLVDTHCHFDMLFTK